MKKLSRAVAAVGLAAGLSVGTAAYEIEHTSPQPASIEGTSASEQINSIETYLKNDVPFKANVLTSDKESSPKVVEDFYVSVQGEHGNAITNPIVLKVGNTVVGYVGRQSNTELEFIPSTGAEFWEMNYADSSNPMLINYPIGRIASRVVQATPEPTTRQDSFKVHGVPSAEIFETVGFNDGSDMYGATTLPITPPQPGEYQD